MPMILATGEVTPIVPPHRREASVLQPFINAVADVLPHHRHAGNPVRQVTPDYSHCSAVECLYYATYYTTNATPKQGSELLPLKAHNKRESVGR